jgi:hypothetical protein
MLGVITNAAGACLGLFVVLFWADMFAGLAFEALGAQR